MKEQADSSVSQANRSGSIENGTKKTSRGSGSAKGSDEGGGEKLVLKVTSILSRHQRDIAEKEAKLLSRLTHPSIVKMIDTCYRTVPASTGSGFRKAADDSKSKDRQQHLILMEYCEGGHAMDVCTQLVEKGERFDLSTLIIAFGQICNAVSYLHAQRPPIVHRDLKPENFLVKNGAYKLCDFGSAVFGHVELKTPKARQEAEEVIEKTTTQMFRAPEMVDLYMAKKLTQATDVWALGCCLFSLAFLKNCFEEGSNLAILSRNYKIPDDNPYGDGLVELIDRMLTEDSKARADMTEVILCLSAVYSGKPLPPRKERKSKEKKEKEHSGDKEKEKSKEKKKKAERAGTFRTDGQGVEGGDLTLTLDPNDPNRPKEAKKLDPNSAAARRRRAAAGNDNPEFSGFGGTFEAGESNGEVNQDLAFSTSDNPFASFEGSKDEGSKTGSGGGDGIFGSFDNGDAASWDGNEFEDLKVTDDRGRGRGRGRGREQVQGDDIKKKRSRSQDKRRSQKNRDVPKDETPEQAIDRLAEADDDEDELAAMAKAAVARGAPNPSSPSKKAAAAARRGVRRVVSNQPSITRRSNSRGPGLRRAKSGRNMRQSDRSLNGGAASSSKDASDSSESSGSE